MISRIGYGRSSLLLAAGISMASIVCAHAQALPSTENSDAAVTECPAADTDTNDCDAKDADGKELDWSLLNVDASDRRPGLEGPPRATARRINGNVVVIEREAERLGRGIGEAGGLAVPGYKDRRRHDRRPAAFDPDLVRIAFGKTGQWRQPAAIVRHRMGGDHGSRSWLNMGQDRGRSTARSGAGAEQARHLLEQVAAADRAIFADPAERLQCDPAGHGTGARHPRPPGPELRNRPDGQAEHCPGTSLIAGRTLSTVDDKWLGKVGAEQKLFDAVSISGSIGETVSGAANKSITAGFKRSW
jgi:hypothetical protein